MNINRVVDLLYPLYKGSIKNNWLLFDTMAQIHDESIIADSSKSIYRYLFLKKYRKHNTKLIVLIRDVFGVAS